MNSWLNDMNLFKLILCLPLLLQVVIDSSKINEKHKISRKRRNLIFSGSDTIVQLILGFGVPVALRDASVTVGMVLKGSYNTPSNASFFTTHHHYVDVEKGKGNKPIWETINRWDLYRMITGTIDSLGYWGKSCIKKSICEAAAAPFSGHEIFDELVHTFFTPSSTKEPVRMNTDYEYIVAENDGLTQNCDKFYPDCDLNILEIFSRIIPK